MRIPDYPDAKHENEFERGLKFQDFVVETLYKKYGLMVQVYSAQRYQFTTGESIQGWEIKLDTRCTDTGRLSVEVAEKTKAVNRMWVKSGLFREDNTIFYVQGNYDAFWVFFKKHLVWYYNKYKPEITVKRGTIKTWYLDINWADYLGWRIDIKEDVYQPRLLE